jgi:glutamate/tyrosine decarboxylase-like PLP-dependent enzyme
MEHSIVTRPVQRPPRPAEDECAVLDLAHREALAFLGGLDARPVGVTAGVAELRARLGGPLPAGPSDPCAVIDRLVADVEAGLLGSTTGRFFGWVIGGALPVAVAAEWLTTAWDQNAAAYGTSPAAAVVEEVCGGWLKQVLGLPAGASFAFVTGCQMAHATALAAARHRLLADRGIDVERDGLAGAPRLRVLASELRHESLMRAIRLLGLGARAVQLVPCDAAGRMDMAALAAALEDRGPPTIVCLQAGDLNTGAFDQFGPACALARAAGAWVHVDGAFGLWASASARLRPLLRDVEQADSWATDGHKWLNLPQDSGFVFVADPAAHRAAFAQDTSYALVVDDTRRAMDWNPEWSRRARAFAAYAAIAALGQSGIAAMIERCCDLAAALAGGLAAMPGVELLSPPAINQALVRFRDPDGAHDRRTEEVVRAIQASGIAWFGATTWQGRRAMRISVCNWRTDEADVERTLAAFREILARL